MDYQGILEDEDKLKSCISSMFAKVDTDQSGGINKSELKTAMRNMLKEMKDAGYELVEMSEEDEEESFKDIDTDGDGSISEEEFGVIVVEYFEALGGKQN